MKVSESLNLKRTDDNNYYINQYVEGKQIKFTKVDGRVPETTNKEYLKIIETIDLFYYEYETERKENLIVFSEGITGSKFPPVGLAYGVENALELAIDMIKKFGFKLYLQKVKEQLEKIEISTPRYEKEKEENV